MPLKMLTIAIGVLLGSLVAHHGYQPASMLITLLSCGLILGIAWKTRQIFLLAIILGFVFTVVQIDRRLGWKISDAWEGASVDFIAQVIDLPTEQRYGTSVLVHPETICYQGDCLKPASISIRLFWPDAPPLKPGERWKLQARLQPIHGFSNPGSAGDESWHWQQGIRAKGKVTSGELVSSRWHWQRLRAEMMRRMEGLLPDTQTAQLIPALALGVRGDMEEKHWDVLQKTGTSHLMAISGLHVGGIAAVFYSLLLVIWRRFPSLSLRIAAPLPAAWGAIIAAILYSTLAGFSVPTQRAMIMVAAFMGSTALRRPMLFQDRWGLALILVCLWDPFAPLSAGFWLSFGAVAIIAYALKAAQGQNRWQKTLTAQWAAFIGLMPLSIAFFEQSSLLSPLANTLAIPWMSLVIVPLVFAATWALSFSTSVASALFLLADYALQALWWFLQWLASGELALWRVGGHSSLTIIVAVIGTIWLLAPRKFPGKHWGWLCFLPFLMGAEPLLEGHARVTFLDVGQGLAVVVETRQHTLIYDTGPPYGPRSDAAKKVLLPFLHHQQISNIDLLILSHLDSDHAGGAKRLLKEMPTAAIHSSEKYPGGQRCQAGESWTWDGVRFEYLSPDRQSWATSKNNQSCVLKISTEESSVLLTGDIEAEGETHLLESVPEALKSTILLAPHHGSKTSSTASFLEAVDPTTIIISTGYRNAYHHPHPSVMARYRAQDLTIAQTVKQGAIECLLFPSEAPQVTYWRD